jgi:hypothetical protein
MASTFHRNPSEMGVADSIRIKMFQEPAEYSTYGRITISLCALRKQEYIYPVPDENSNLKAREQGITRKRYIFYAAM